MMSQRSSQSTMPLITITVFAAALTSAASALANETSDDHHQPRYGHQNIPSSTATNKNENIPSIMALILVTTDTFLESCSQSTTVTTAVSCINSFLLSYARVPERSLLTPDEFVLSIFAMLVTLLVYFLCFGKRHVKKRTELAESLKLAQLQVRYLEEKLLLAKADNAPASNSSSSSPPSSGKEVRIFMDGAFDMMHYGHMNAFRLGRSLGTHLVVGINSDASITKCKGAPLMNDQERLTMVEGCKFVDEVVPGCPYIMNEEYLDYVIKKFKIDYVIHGDDPCIVDGKDVYASAKKMGKYQSIPRTEGVSTTDIVGRMLLMTKEHHAHPTIGENNDAGADCATNDVRDAEDRKTTPSKSTLVFPTMLGEQSKFLTTSRMLRLFSAGVTAPTNDMKVIYMDGAWDMFHCGHVAVLKAAKERGDYLIVGIHGDAVVNRKRGSNLPLMNLHERVLSVLGCRFVDDVLIDAPWAVTPEMVASLKIAEVVHGSRSDDLGISRDEDNRYAYPREIGILNVINSPSEFNLGSILNRIEKNQETFQAKINKKKKAENEYYQERYRKENTTTSQ